MNETTPVAVAAPITPRARALSRIAAGLGLGFIGALLAWQMTHLPLAALGAGLGAGIMAFASWATLVLRPASVDLGRAVLVGALSVIAGYLGMAILGGAGSSVVTDPDSGIVLLFSVWIVAPISLAVALAVAVATKLLGAPKAG